MSYVGETGVAVPSAVQWFTTLTAPTTVPPTYVWVDPSEIAPAAVPSALIATPAPDALTVIVPALNLQ